VLGENLHPCQEKFEGIHNNIFTEVSTSKEKNFSCVDFIGAKLPPRCLLSANAASPVWQSEWERTQTVHRLSLRDAKHSRGVPPAVVL
jgi:hypothetical protein